ncbi:hypothetical protein NFHSH190041_08970 [Shewanella sp. NFH-SH190041]|nr:hypothetical protein NFHSH190041_08970 [Shewanella sp. NFH-SH190041]
MLIRAVEHRDWPAIMAIQEACYHAFDPEPLSVMQSKWHLSPSTCFISEYHHRVVGYCLAHPWRGAPPALNQQLPTQISQPDTLYLHDMALAPQAQGLGAGQAMLKQLNHTSLSIGTAHALFGGGTGG